MRARSPKLWQAGQKECCVIAPERFLKRKRNNAADKLAALTLEPVVFQLKNGRSFKS